VTRIKWVSSAVTLVFIGRLLLIPGEKLERDAEVQAAYEEYRSCVRIDIFCNPADPCPALNCMGEFLRRSEEINRHHILLSLLKPRHLLSGWQPFR
jgi:hypothetical protein